MHIKVHQSNQNAATLNFSLMSPKLLPTYQLVSRKGYNLLSYFLFSENRVKLSFRYELLLIDFVEVDGKWMTEREIWIVK